MKAELAEQEMTMRKIMRKSIAFGLVMLMVLLSACKSGSAGEGTSAQGSSMKVKSTGKSELVLVTGAEPTHFFAQAKLGFAGADNLVLSNVYDCLLRVEADGELTPALASGYTVSEDGCTYTFPLHKGVKFHNGKEMTAEDVKFTLDLGVQNYVGKALLINYKDSKVVNDYLLEVHLSAPYAAFPNGIASRIGSVICKSYYEEVGEEGYFKHPVGTGPYRFEEYVPGHHISFAANTDYWRGEPTLKKVTISMVNDTDAQIKGLTAGQFDVLVNPSISDCLKLEGIKGVDWDTITSTGRITLYLNDWNGPCMNRDFRRAIQCAVNKEEIKDKIWYGDTVVLDIDMCPNYAAYPTVDDGIEVVDYDPERAKKLLKDSGYKGEEFTITVEDGSMLEDVAELICDQLSEIGIHCRVDDIASEEFYNVRIKRMYQATIVDNICSLMDADGMLTAHNADGPYFEERLFERDPEIIELLEKGRAVQGEERIPFYVKACNIITEEAYEVPLVNNLSTIAFNNKLTGVEAHCLGLCYFVDWKWE